MNKPIIMMALAAVAVFTAAEIAIPAAFAQYGGDQTPAPSGSQATTNVTPQQLKTCQQLGIAQSECNDNTILAKRRLTTAEANPSTGSGTPMFATQGGQLIIFIIVLGVIFGGVAAVFFFKGRGAKQVTT